MKFRVVEYKDNNIEYKIEEIVFRFENRIKYNNYINEKTILKDNLLNINKIKEIFQQYKKYYYTHDSRQFNIFIIKHYFTDGSFMILVYEDNDTLSIQFINRGTFKDNDTMIDIFLNKYKSIFPITEDKYFEILEEILNKKEK